MLASLYLQQVEISDNDVSVFSITGTFRVNLQPNQSSQSQSSPEASFLKGHLAILLGLLCSGVGAKYVDSILRHLPGDHRQDKLERLIATIREFVGLYADLAKKFAQALRANQEEEQDASVDDENDNTEETAPLAAPLIFGDDSQGSQKGIELAERVIRVLSGLQVLS